MRFVRAVWKLLVGIKDALVLVLLLLFFGLLYVGLSAKPKPVGDGVLAMVLDGNVVEQPSRPSTAELVSGGARATREHRLRDLVAVLREAKADDRVKAVALDLDSFVGGGEAALIELGDAIRDVRSAKPVIAYATGYTDDSYLLAANASEIWINPLGAAAMMGPGGNQLYYKGLFDKLGVTAHVYRVGTYKSAVEPYIRNDMSAPARENAQALGDALLERWREAVRQGRPAAGVDAYMRDPVAAVTAAQGDLAKAALQAKIVDRIADRRGFEARLAALGGKDDHARGGYKRISLDSYINDVVDQNPAGPIGVVTIAGMIVDGEAGAGTAGGDTIARIIDKGLREKDLKALVVRVDSPGGSVLASERIRQAIMAVKDRGIPVVVSMGNVAASGGYWVSTPANYVFADPATITGSIGVFGVLPSFEGTLAKLGIGADGIKTTPLSGEPDFLKGPSPASDALVQAGVNGIYAKFLGIVAAARHRTPAEIDRIAQGRVWDGGSAHQLGLVDGFGGMDEAIAKAAALANLGDERSLRYLDRPATFRESIMELLADEQSDGTAPTDALATLSPAPASEVAAGIAELQSILAGPTIQVRCLDCPPPATPVLAPAASNAPWWSWIARLL